MEMDAEADREMDMVETRRELEKQIEELRNDIEFLEIEGSVFAKFLEKKKAEMLSTEEEEKKKSKSLKKRNFPVQLTSEQKYDVANTMNEGKSNEMDIHS